MGFMVMSEPVNRAREGEDPGKKSILVVDDERDLLRMLSRMLTEAGYRVATATNGEEALALARVHSFDLILSDIHMPRMNGVVLCEKLRELEPAPAVIIMSGSIEEFSVELEALGGVFLRKPITRSELLTAIRAKLESRTPRQE